MSQRSRLRILVIDDDPDNADSLRQLLTLWGHEAEAAYDGASALSVAELLCPHVVLVDLAMPGLNGFDFAQQFRQRVEGQSALLFAVTGLADEARLQKTSKVGFTDYMIKPVPPDFLQRVLSLIDFSDLPNALQKVKKEVEQNRNANDPG
jgi:CheY-like chemotaxis protein